MASDAACPKYDAALTTLDVALTTLDVALKILDAAVLRFHPTESVIRNVVALIYLTCC
jgi:hypothetical protein